MPPAPVKKSSQIVIPEKPRCKQRAAAQLIRLIIRTISATLRYKYVDNRGLAPGAKHEPAIYCFWHNRLSVSAMIYRNYIRKSSAATGVAAMVSASRDGGMLVAVVQSFGVQPARGSSSRRGPQAMRELTSWAKRGYDLAITPDGPRGPRYKIAEGVVALAQLTELPVVPASYNLSWKISVKSWDRFQIPLPFSRCEVFLEKPVHVPRETSPEERESLRLKIEQTMQAVSRD
jgi:lysophospholipid acyltransferase (LPLAT)-like uncharacterized protein